MKNENEISLLADYELDSVVGGRSKTGMDPKPLPGGSVSAGDPFTSKLETGTLLTMAIETMVFMALW